MKEVFAGATEMEDTLHQERNMDSGRQYVSRHG